MNRIELVVCALFVTLFSGCNLSDPAPTPASNNATADATGDVSDDVDDSGGLDAGDDDAAEGSDTASPDADAEDDVVTCVDPEELCGATCRNTETNPDHCGACNARCRPPANAVVQACQAGDCVYACDDGYFDLNDNLSDATADGCEATCRPTNGGAEACDQVDNDCDGTIDEGCECNPGEPRDCGSDEGACQTGTQTCDSDGTWGACEGAVGPQGETCDDVDNDCDGRVDENLERPCGTSQGACTQGTQTCVSGAWGSCTGGSQGSDETCDGIDNDCDGDVDEGLTRTCGTNTGACSTGSETCSGGSWGSCQGNVASSPETCDGQDNDCDGQTDEGVTTTYYFDSDDDGYGTSSSVQRCGPTGNYTATQSGDCDDGNDSIYPGAPFLTCNATDYDCDGITGCADNNCNDGDPCSINTTLGTCSGSLCDTGGPGPCRQICGENEYCTCGGDICCPNGQSCLCP